MKKLAFQSWGLYVFAGGVVLFVCAVVGTLLFEARSSELERASKEAGNLVAILARQIDRNMGLFDLALEAAAAGSRDPTVMSAAPELRQRILFGQSAAADGLGSMFISDEAGHIVAESDRTPASPADIVQRQGFIDLMHRPGTLYISQPYKSREDGSLILCLNRRIVKAGGEFGGIVSATLHLGYLRKMFAELKIADHATIGLFRVESAGSTLVMRRPYMSERIGQTYPTGILIKRLALAPEDNYIAMSPVDHVERFIHYKRIADTPLVLTVSLSTDAIFADWWRKSAIVVSLLTLFSVSTIFLAIRLKSELNRRAAAEAALFQVSREDGLTGLANRRHFDIVLDTEWRRAARHGSSLALLLIDVDHFKLYNDTSGHLAGDDVLKALGTLLRSRVRRAGEVAARFGGEEFAVILPSADAARAAAVAETIRLDVIALGIPHPCHQMLSVSIGVATLIPARNEEATVLIARADAALYACKTAGRNRTACYDEIAALRVA